MQKILILLIGIAFFCSCAGTMKNASIAKEYRNIPLLDKKLVVLPFSRDALSFDIAGDAAVFDSLDTATHGMMLPVLNMIFSGTVAATADNCTMASMNDSDIIARLSEISCDTSAMRSIKPGADRNPAYSTTSSKPRTIRFPEGSRVRAIVPDAQVGLIINRIHHSRKQGKRRLTAEYVFFSLDSNKIITSGDADAKLAFSESYLKKHPKGDLWLKWMADIGYTTIAKSPFCSIRDFMTPINFSYSRSRKKIISIEQISERPRIDYLMLNHIHWKLWNVSTTVDSLLGCLPKALIPIMTDTLKFIPFDSVPRARDTVGKRAYDENSKRLFTTCVQMCGMLILEATKSAETGLSFRRYYSTIGNERISETISAVFGAKDSVAAIEPAPPGSFRFMVPIQVSIQPESWDKEFSSSIDSIFASIFSQITTITYKEILQQVGVQQTYLAIIRTSVAEDIADMDPLRWMRMNDNPPMQFLNNLPQF